MKRLKYLLAVPLAAFMISFTGLAHGSYAWSGENGNRSSSFSFEKFSESDFSKSVSLNFSKSTSSENFLFINRENGNNNSFTMIMDNKMSSNVNLSLQENISSQTKNLVAVNNTTTGD